MGGQWSTYWYNGYIYGTEIARGLDIFRLMPSEFLSQNEIDAASQVHSTEFNAQFQQQVTWAPTSAVARAYLDQLGRTKGVTTARAAAVKSALERADRIKGASDNGAPAANEALTTLATDLEKDASAAAASDAARLKSLAATLRSRAENHQ